jgi:cell division protein FtsI/penicillin-binding protein 2
MTRPGPPSARPVRPSAGPVRPPVPSAPPFPASAPLDVRVPPSAPLDVRVPPSAPLDVPVPPSAPLVPLVPPSGPLAPPSTQPAARQAPGRPALPASGLRASLTPKRVVAAVCAVAVLALMLVSAKSPDPSAEPTVQQFLLAWEQGEYRMAAALTTGDPNVVTAALRTAYQQLDAADITLSMGRIIQHGDTGEAQFNASIDLGRSGAPWLYQGQFALHRIGSDWKVVWHPSVINPGLRPGLRLAVVTTMPKRAALLDASGRPLERRSRVVVAGVRPGRLTDPQRTADRLADATHLPANEVYGEILAAPSAHFFELVRFRPSTYHRLRGKLRRVPGLVIKRTRLRLFESAASSIVGSVGTETAKVLRIDGVPYRPGTTVGLSGLQLAYQHFLVGTPTTEVVAENAAGRHVSVLKRWPGAAGKPVRTTIHSAVQAAADSAIRSLPRSAAIVAVRASNGKILAVATHKAHGMPAVNALDGRYRPGQTFTIVSTAALITSGFNVATRIPCKNQDPVGGRTFRNSPRESGLGMLPPFSTDFARACSTAFAGLSQRLQASQLTSAAGPRGFGLGAQWQLPLSAFAGSLGSRPDDAQLAADSIGAGTVLTSPLDMALVAALVQSGTWHRPTLVTSPPDPGLSPRVPFGPRVVGMLRTLMRRTVKSGAGHAANVRGAAVYGQVGNVLLGIGHHGLRASWFVGYRGGVAFAVLEFTGSPRTSAAPVAGKFLRDLSASP